MKHGGDYNGGIQGIFQIGQSGSGVKRRLVSRRRNRKSWWLYRARDGGRLSEDEKVRGEAAVAAVSPLV